VGASQNASFKKKHFVLGLAAGAVLIAIVLLPIMVLGDSGNGLHFKLIGQTAAVRYYGGTIRSVSSGFTPKDSYTTMVWGPNGKPYKGNLQSGYVDVYGKTSNWSWNAGGTVYYGAVDPPGRYKVVVIDNATGRATNPVYFTVSPDPAAKKKP
jgi:hypothetical protein